MTKLNYFLLAFAFAVGCFIGNRFKDSPPPAVSQNQSQDQSQDQGQKALGACVAEVGKKTNADGSVEDFFRFRANMKANQGQNSAQAGTQSQVLVQADASIDIFAGGGASSKGQGWGAAEAITGKHSLEYITNGPEWIGLYKIKVLSF